MNSARGGSMIADHTSNVAFAGMAFRPAKCGPLPKSGLNRAKPDVWNGRAGYPANPNIDRREPVSAGRHARISGKPAYAAMWQAALLPAGGALRWNWDARRRGEPWQCVPGRPEIQRDALPSCLTLFASLLSSSIGRCCSVLRLAGSMSSVA